MATAAAAMGAVVTGEVTVGGGLVGAAREAEMGAAATGRRRRWNGTT